MWEINSRSSLPRLWNTYVERCTDDEGVFFCSFSGWPFITAEPKSDIFVAGVHLHTHSLDFTTLNSLCTFFNRKEMARHAHFFAPPIFPIFFFAVDFLGVARHNIASVNSLCSTQKHIYSTFTHAHLNSAYEKEGKKLVGFDFLRVVRQKSHT